MYESWRKRRHHTYCPQVLEVSTEAMERRLDQDFADAYEASDLYRRVDRQTIRSW